MIESQLTQTHAIEKLQKCSTALLAGMLANPQYNGLTDNEKISKALSLAVDLSNHVTRAVKSASGVNTARPAPLCTSSNGQETISWWKLW